MVQDVTGAQAHFAGLEPTWELVKQIMLIHRSAAKDTKRSVELRFPAFLATFVPPEEYAKWRTFICMKTKDAKAIRDSIGLEYDKDSSSLATKLIWFPRVIPAVAVTLPTNPSEAPPQALQPCPAKRRKICAGFYVEGDSEACAGGRVGEALDMMQNGSSVVYSFTASRALRMSKDLGGVRALHAPECSNGGVSAMCSACDTEHKQSFWTREKKRQTHAFELYDNIDKPDGLTELLLDDDKLMSSFSRNQLENIINRFQDRFAAEIMKESLLVYNSMRTAKDCERAQLSSNSKRVIMFPAPTISGTSSSDSRRVGAPQCKDVENGHENQQFLRHVAAIMRKQDEEWRATELIRQNEAQVDQNAKEAYDLLWLL